MASATVSPYTSATVTVQGGNKLATYSNATYRIDSDTKYSNQPQQTIKTFEGTGSYTTSAYAIDTVVKVTAGAQPVLYSAGSSPSIIERSSASATANGLNATGTLTVGLIQGGIVTSTTASAVTATLDTGAVMDSAHTMAINDGFLWSAINTGSNSFTVTASSGHTIVGSGIVSAGTSGRFQTIKTATNTFTTYRLA